MDDVGHAPVMLEQVLSFLPPRDGAVVVDATLGRGGHALAIAQRLSEAGHLIGLDADRGNAEFAAARLEAAKLPCGHTVEHGNFAALDAVLDRWKIAKVDGVLADLGFSSTQVDDPSRGLSFRGDGPLDMRLDQTKMLTAAELVNTLDERSLADLIYQYGEERLSRRIAARIVQHRRTTPIETTQQLAQLVRSAYPHAASGRHRVDPATRTFQALRIAVNDEVGVLERLLGLLPKRVSAGGRAVIIAFHSLEDRPVKLAMAEWEKAGLGRRLTRKPLVADEAEVARNPRSRSAKLRAFEFGA